MRSRTNLPQILRKANMAVARQTPIYEQGDLDGLCGIYSLINAINRLYGPLRTKHTKGLLEELIYTLDSKWGVQDAILYGINGFQLSSLINEILKPRYQITCKKPFHSRPDADTNIVWKKIREWTENGGVVILGTEEHWTVIERASDSCLFLVDSCRMRILHKRHLIQRKNPRHRMKPQYLYFVKKSEELP